MKKKRPDLAKRNKEKAIHNMENTPTYITWKNMKSRCQYEKDKDYPRYGGRGIKICEEWKNFSNFLRDMGIKPEKAQIDRIDNNGNYELSNCRWVSNQENSNNRSSNVYIEYSGKTQTIAQWARELNIGPKTLRHRLFVAHWPIDLALNKEVKKYGFIRSDH